MGRSASRGDRRHFEHADGTPFFWLGDTWWMGLCERLKWPEEFQTLDRDRKTKGFTVIQIVAGLYPDMPAFDPRGSNESGIPLGSRTTAGFARSISIEADLRLAYLADQGLVPCVVMAWGYHLPWLGVERMKKHVRYVIARYGALPVVWCMAGEVNLPYYLEKGFPRGGEAQTSGLGRRDQVRALLEWSGPAHDRASHRHRAPQRAAALS